MSSKVAAWYEIAAREIRDPRFLYMNHGYAGIDSESRLMAACRQPYSVELVRHCIEDSVKESAVLDVGCGRGGACEYLADRFDVRRVVGLDISTGNIRACTTRRRSPRVRYLVGDAERLPLADDSFDLVINIESSHCYGSRHSFCEEAYRVLRPGGRLCLADGGSAAELDGLRSDLQGAGFLPRRECNITANVIRAIELNRAEQRRLFRDLARAKTATAAFVAQLDHTISYEVHARYVSGQLQYRSWVCAKQR